MYVFNKILIIYFTKLACFSLWTERSLAHSFKAGQGQQRNYKAHSGVQKWMFGHLLCMHWRAGFWFWVTWQSEGKADMERLFACPREGSRRQSRELLWRSIRMAKWRWPGHLLCLEHSSGQTDSLLLLLQLPRRQFWWGQLSQAAMARPLPAAGCTGAASLLSPLFPTPALLLLPPLWDCPWPLFFVAALQRPQCLCLALYVCTKQPNEMSVWALQVHVGCR